MIRYLTLFYLMTGMMTVGYVHGSNSARCPDSWKMSPYEMLTLIPLWFPLLVSSVTYTVKTGKAQSPLRCEVLKNDRSSQDAVFRHAVSGTPEGGY